MAVIVSIWALFFFSKIIIPGECLTDDVRQAFLQVNDETYLPNHVIETKHAETEFECSMDCFQHGTCVSVNYKISGVGKGRCELNSRTLQDADDDGSTRNPEFKHIHIIEERPKIYPTCSILRKAVPTAGSGEYRVNPQGLLVPVFCNMTSKNGVGVTEIGHNSESKTPVNGYEDPGSYKRKIEYEISMEQIVAIVKESKNCEQFIKYECSYSVIFKGKRYAWWESRQGLKMNYWGGAAVDSGNCSCGMTNSCAGGFKCNCDNNDKRWREDSGYLTDKNKLPVTELRFGDTGESFEEGYHTLGKLRCWD